MIGRLTAALVLAATGAAAAGPLAAVTEGDDPFAARLIGPSGQVWTPDGHGGWTRTTEGGVAADVAGAVFTDRVVVVGKGAPPYRLDAGGWQAVRLGERGKTVAGRGPRASLAIGRQVFVWQAGPKPGWQRVATAPGPVVALWAASDRKLYVAGADRLWRLAGNRLVDHATVAVTGFATGAAPLALTADGQVYDVAARKAAPITVGGAPLLPAAATTAADGSAWVIGTGGGATALAHRVRGAWQALTGPTLAADDRPLAVGVAADGAVVVPTASGAVWIGRGGAWSPATVTDVRPPAAPGPGPARMP